MLRGARGVTGGERVRQARGDPVSGFGIIWKVGLGRTSTARKVYITVLRR